MDLQLMGEVAERFAALVEQVRALGLRIDEWDRLDPDRAYEMLGEMFGFAVHEHVVDWFSFTYGSNAMAESLVWVDGYLYDYGATNEVFIEMQAIEDEDFDALCKYPDTPEELRRVMEEPHLKVKVRQGHWMIARHIEVSQEPTVWYLALDGLRLYPFLLPRRDGVIRPCTLPELLAQRQHDFSTGQGYVHHYKPDDRGKIIQDQDRAHLSLYMAERVAELARSGDNRGVEL